MIDQEGGKNRSLRIMLIAYEFPPSPSPQSLRWAYLSGRLAALGHEVHVMAPDIGGMGRGLPCPGGGVRVYRVPPGPVRSVLGWLEHRRPLKGGENTPVDGTGGDDPFAAPDVVDPPRLNWKGRLVERFQDLVSKWVFPDLRGEWALPAERALPALLNSIRPDVVVTSHEPATTLLLGLRAKALGARWVADLGDPVLAPYTPRRWHRRALELERKTVQAADHVLVTTAATQNLLQQRHCGGAPISVVPQGFDDLLEPLPEGIDSRRRNRPLELLYAGSFYAFRDPRALVDGVLEVEGVRLNIASGSVPDWLFPLAAAHPGQLRLLGRIPHRRLLDLQRRADVLVNIANADPAQIPGKVYEYFGAGRPILHLEAQPEDAVGGLIMQLGRGMACAGNGESVAAAVSRLVARAREGCLDDGFDLSLPPVVRWSWTAVARGVEQALLDSCGEAGNGRSRAPWVI